MSKVLAKFRLSNLEDAKYAPEGSVSLQFQGVQGEPFGSATPSADARMVVQNTAAAAIFRDAYAHYVAAAQAWTAADKETRGAYPQQPEFYVTFEFDEVRLTVPVPLPG